MSPNLEITPRSTEQPAVTPAPEAAPIVLSPQESFGPSGVNPDTQQAIDALSRSTAQSLNLMQIPEVLKLASTLKETGVLTPEQQSDIDIATSAFQDNFQITQVLLYSFITGQAISQLQSMSELSPEVQEHARLALLQMLEKASDEDLEKLASQISAPGQDIPQTRAELLEYLKGGNLLERGLQNPDVALTLAKILNNSNVLPEEAQQLMSQSLNGAQESLEFIKATIVLILVKLAIEEGVRKKAPKREEPLVQDQSILHPGTNMEYLPTLRWQLEEALGKSGQEKDPWKEIEVKALQEQDKKRQEKAEEERKNQDTDRAERLKKLEAQVQQILRENPGLVGTLAAMALQQQDFLSELGRPTPRFVNAQFTNADRI